MITTQHTQESLSRAYIHAVAGCAGVNWAQKSREFDYGIDGTFRPVAMRGSRRVETGFPLDFQLKCTMNWAYEGDQLSYIIKSKTYNDLVEREAEEIGVVLVLLCVPPIQSDWADFTEDYLTLRRCCYYTILQGQSVPNENSTKKIFIPRSNILNSTSLLKLLQDERERRQTARAA